VPVQGAYCADYRFRYSLVILALALTFIVGCRLSHRSQVLVVCATFEVDSVARTRIFMHTLEGSIVALNVTTNVFVITMKMSPYPFRDVNY
jgi:hypothetical protein